MFITMQCGGLPFNGNTIKERSLGGSESAAYYMARSLADMGHKVTLFTNHQEGGEFDGVRYVWAGQPSEESPLGEQFEFYAQHTPCDVLIIQRAPGAFIKQYHAKQKLLWLHDLALDSYKPQVAAALHNITGILCVSEFHKQQVCDVYGLNPDGVHAITNGVDLALYEGIENQWIDAPDTGLLRGDKKYLIYSHRPERGLEHLVRPEGIMHRLWEAGQRDYHLLVCGYDNTTPQMEGLYNTLWNACDVLPNVTNLGALTKKELADLQQQCYAHIYPSEFEETSCITAMECMAAGLPIVGSDVGAFPETVKGAGAKVIPLKDGKADEDAFVQYFGDCLAEHREDMASAQLQAAGNYTWAKAADRLMAVVVQNFNAQSNTAKLRHLIEMSDIYAAAELVPKCPDAADDPIVHRAIAELGVCYRFAFDDDFAEHYRGYYEYEKARGVDYGPEILDGNSRFEYVSGLVSMLPEGSSVLDYGCAHGHYTINLAKRFPQLDFVGVDITLSNVEKAKAWAESEKLDNVRFFHGTQDEALTHGPYDFVIAAEVIEHVADYAQYVDALHMMLHDKGTMCITTPYGPWEAQGYKEHHPWRAHLHHFERADLHEVWGHMDGFNVVCLPSGPVVGSYATTFTRTPGAKSGKVDYERKLAELMPRQTLSLCMIVRNAEDTLLRTLRSVEDSVDEIRIFIDPDSDDRTEEVIKNFERDTKLWPVITVKTLSASPLEQGFDAARNESIEGAAGDWVLWMDADEIMNYPEHMGVWLQENPLLGYAVAQHHFSAEPLGVMKTDYPCRLFRNGRGVRFFGVVHEHPETELNAGVGHLKIAQGFEILHNGYQNERVRRKRFDRNIDLMKADREKYPDRHLGKFLWIRDIAQMLNRGLREEGLLVDDQVKKAAADALALWDDLIQGGQIRMLVDGLEWHNQLVTILGGKIEVSFTLDTAPMPGSTSVANVSPLTGVFLTEDDAKHFLNTILHERVKGYGSKYAF